MERSRDQPRASERPCAGLLESAGRDPGEARAIREEIPSYQDEVRDTEEQSVTDFAQEMDFALMEMKAQTLIRIDEALQRVDQGTYGTCDECGQDIAAARLSAVPFALLCLECQEREETLAAEERALAPSRRCAPRLRFPRSVARLRSGRGRG